MNRKEFLHKAVGGGLLLMFAGVTRAADDPASTPSRWGGRVDLTDLGVRPDSDRLCTGALQKAIDLCHERKGGTVFIPAGRFVTGTVVLRSFVTLELGPGAVLLGSTRPEDYPRQPTPKYRSLVGGGSRALIYAEGAENIGLCGSGCIDGQGGQYNGGPSTQEGRPRLIQFISCREVRVEGLRLRNSVLWMQHYLDCENVQLRGLNVWNHANHNNDMIDIDGCRQVTISDCIGDTDDDGITLKSTGPAACENVVITNCVVSSHCNALKCGTESSGGYRNITISNCVVKPSAVKTKINGIPEGLSAISLEVVDGGAMDGVIAENIAIEGTLVPIFVRLGNRARPYLKNGPTPGVGTLKNVRIANVVARRAGNIGCSITGLPQHRVEDITLSGVHVELAAAGEAVDPRKPLSEKERAYPEGRMWGPLPACGFYVRHAARVRFFDVTITPAAGEPRPKIVKEDVVESTGLDS